MPRYVVERLAALLLVVLCAATAGAAGDDTSRQVPFRAMGLPFYGGNEVRVLPTAEGKVQALMEDIARARSYVHLDYYKFQQDSVCAVLFNLLRRKAAEGVDVRVIYDFCGNKCSSLPLTPGYLDTLRRDGVRIHAFDRVRFPWINHFFHRDHHKIAVIDGALAYSGGMNVADYYLHGKPGVGKWRDMHMRLRGPVVAGYERVFGRMWLLVTGERLDTLPAADALPVPDGAPIALADRVPRVTASIVRDTYCAALDSARSLVQIVNPYPTLCRSIRRSLYRALERGVRVQFMLSTKTDGVPNMDVAGVEMRRLMRRGAEVYYYNGGFHHSKVMMVDSAYCTIGTANLDARSLRFDYEINSLIFDRRTTASLQRIFDKDVREHCTYLTPGEWKRRFPLRRRLRCALFMLIKGVL